MTWFCSKCNYQTNPDDISVCVGCGSRRCPRRVVLTSPATALSISMTVDTVIGRGLLKAQGLVGEDYRYAGEEQYRILLHATGLPVWSVQHCQPNINATLLDGVALGFEPFQLSNGSSITVGSTSAQLVVTLTD